MKNKLLFSFALAASVVFSSHAEKKSMAYIINKDYSTNYKFDDDKIHQFLDNIYDVTVIDVALSDVTNETIEGLASFDVVFSGEAVASGHARAASIGGLIDKVPMVNMKSFYYNKTGWGLGVGKNPATMKSNEQPVNAFLLDVEYYDHELFDNITIDSDGTVPVFDVSSEYKNQMQGFELTGAGYENDLIFGKATGESGSYDCMHLHNSDKKYIGLAISYDNLGTISENGLNLIKNCVEYVIKHSASNEDDTKNASINAEKAIASISYYSITGAKLAGPALGVNIKKTVYKDGSVKAVKTIIK